MFTFFLKKKVSGFLNRNLSSIFLNRKPSKVSDFAEFARSPPPPLPQLGFYALSGPLFVIRSVLIRW